MAIIGVLSAGMPAPASEFRLPVVGEEEALLGMDRIFVRKIRLTGNTVFSREDLSFITAAYENLELGTAELQALQKKLTLHYVDKGYINSGVVLPDQRSENGEILLEVIEGVLKGVRISGNRGLKDGYIKDRLELEALDKTPLNIIEIRNRLGLLKQDPHIEWIHAELKPGLKPGQAELEIRVKESVPYQVEFRFNNHNSPSLGSYRGEMAIRHNNLTGFGDAVNAQYALTEGVDEYLLEYEVPVSPRDTKLGFQVERSESVIVAAPFDDLDIKTKTTTFSVSIRHPLFKTTSRELAAGGIFEYLESKSALLGEGFAFSRGVEDDGESHETVLRFYMEYIHRSMEEVVAFRSTVSWGVDMLGATVSHGKPDGRFLTFQGQFQWLRELTLFDSQILFKSILNLSSDPLLPMEKFSMGGPSTVRGYRKSVISTDNGLVASIEWRVPVFRLRIPGLSRSPEQGRIFLCPFVDFGQGWNTDNHAPDPDHLSSAGLGIIWSIDKRISAEISYGKALRTHDVDEEHDLQDDGIYFELSAAFF